MIEQIFTYLSSALSGSFAIALFAAFGWGILSILLSPCHLSGIPLIIGYISSQGQIKVKNSFSLSLVFAVGILITIATIGLITASGGRLMGDVGIWGNWLVAAIFIIVGLYLMDIIRVDWNRLPLGSSSRAGLWGAFILGLIFGIGLGPCTFAFLAPILALVFQTADNNLLEAILLISAFSLGHCTVIVMAGSLTNIVQRYLDWTEKSNLMNLIKKVTGLLVISGGLYFIFIS